MRWILAVHPLLAFALPCRMSVQSLASKADLLLLLEGTADPDFAAAACTQHRNAASQLAAAV